MTKPRLAAYTAFLLSCAATPPPVQAQTAGNEGLKSITFLQQQLEIEVEVAATQMEQERGLMFRTQMPENHGMLFVFTQPAVVNVWMKNTLLPLDVLFLSADGRIVSMLPNLPPCLKDPCRVYSSVKAGSYMLELNAGFIKNHQLAEGQQLRLPPPG